MLPNQRYLHPDDDWCPISKPTDPCQVHGCQCQKHQFSNHYIRNAGLPGGSLSRWCPKHTMDRGFCLNCGKHQIVGYDEGVCYECRTFINNHADRANEPTAREWTAFILRQAEENPSKYVVNMES